MCLLGPASSGAAALMDAGPGRPEDCHTTRPQEGCFEMPNGAGFKTEDCHTTDTSTSPLLQTRS